MRCVNYITDYLTLLLSCRLLVLYYAIKTPLKTKSPYDFHRRLIGAITLVRTFIPLLYLVCFYTVISKKLYDKKAHQRFPQKRNEIIAKRKTPAVLDCRNARDNRTRRHNLQTLSCIRRLQREEAQTRFHTRRNNFHLSLLKRVLQKHDITRTIL